MAEQGFAFDEQSVVRISDVVRIVERESKNVQNGRVKLLTVQEEMIVVKLIDDLDINKPKESRTSNAELFSFKETENAVEKRIPEIPIVVRSDLLGFHIKDEICFAKRIGASWQLITGGQVLYGRLNQPLSRKGKATFEIHRLNSDGGLGESTGMLADIIDTGKIASDLSPLLFGVAIDAIRLETVIDTDDPAKRIYILAGFDCDEEIE